MRRRTAVALALLFGLAGLTSADLRKESYESFTATNTAVTHNFTDISTSTRFAARTINVVNDGAVNVHINLGGGAATTSSPAIKPGEVYSPPPFDSVYDRPTSVSVITASSTAAVRLYAYE